MFTGWWPSLKFPLNRALAAEEKGAGLSVSAISSEPFDDRGALVGLNSTYIEWIDRRFLVRGSMNTAITFFGFIGLLIPCFGLLYFGLKEDDLDAKMVAIFGSILCFAMDAFLYYAQPRLDFFKKIYYPIRFNRKNRTIYVYRDKKDGGILSVSWDQVFFHVGRGLKDARLLDIRGEVLDGKTVKDTFALGHFSDDPRAVQQMWAFIRRYMDGGPEAVGENPLDRYITLSVSPSLRNCLMMAYGFYGAPNVVIRIISLPFIALTTLTRWLVFKTCSLPTWPAEIEAACQIEPGDPHIWPTPRYTGQFAAENPALVARAQEKVRGVPGASSLADAMGEWQSDIERKR